eukprot:2255159-Amphidinium_carterae.1
MGNHSREEEHLERNDTYRPPPLPPPFPEENGQDELEEPVVVDEEGEEVDRSEPLEIIPELPRERKVQFAEVQYDDDPVDTGARVSTDDYRTPRVPSQSLQAPHRYRDCN